MTKVIAVCNQKGGVAKTTSSINLGIALVRQGKKVLLVDCDPQASLTTSLGFDPDAIGTTLADGLRLVIEHPDSNCCGDSFIMSHPEGVDLIPSNIALAGIELALVTAMSREYTCIFIYGSVGNAASEYAIFKYHYSWRVSTKALDEFLSRRQDITDAFICLDNDNDKEPEKAAGPINASRLANTTKSIDEIYLRENIADLQDVLYRIRGIYGV